MRILTVLLLILSLSSFVEAKEHLEEKAEKIANELQTTKRRLETEDKFRRRVMSSLYSVNQRVKKMSEKKTELTNRMFSTNAEINSLARQIAQLEKKIGSQRAKVARYLRAAYSVKGQSSLQALIETDSLKEFDRTLKFLKIFADRDYRAILEFRENLKLLTAKRTELANEVQNLVQLKSNLQSQEQKLTSEQDSKMKLLAKLRAERQKQITKMKKLRKRGEKIESELFGAEVIELLGVSIYEKKGQILPPVMGPVVQGFGLIKDQEYKFKIAHKGIFFQVPENSEVRSIFKGKVVFAGDLPGYGMAVLVDHGDHYYTVYSYNEVLKVKMGDRVDEGQVIAMSGLGSQHFGRGIYMELRHFSDAIDPLPWLKMNTDFQASSL